MRRQGSDGSGWRSTRVSSRARAACLALPLLCLWLSPAAAQDEAPESEPADLRERLTEREDETRLEDPFSIEVMGRPLFLSGQLELALDTLDQPNGEASAAEVSRRLFEPEFEGELFYAFSPKLSLFAQLRLAMEHDLDSDYPEAVSTTFVERGEMWLSWLDVGGSGLNLEFGRLDFEDDRLWWWDTDLDAVRLSREGESYELALSLARELAPDRSDEDEIAPEHEGVRRLLFEASWDWHEHHSLEAFALRHRDHSQPAAAAADEDDAAEFDGNPILTWIGLRAAGAWESSDRGLFGYWFDLGSVSGHEQLPDATEAEEPEAPEEPDVEASTSRRVRGWAFDLGATWALPLAMEPRLSLGYARGSGDSDPDNGVERAYRQTGLHGNEIGFGGVQRFNRYGRALDPELSNLGVATAGVGISLLQSSSLDLLHHRYRLVEAADSLRDDRLELELDGVDRDLGYGFDLVLALEEWRRFELELSASAFKPGGAVAGEQRDWIWAGYLAFRVAF
jgi:hypothetical protein